MLAAYKTLAAPGSDLYIVSKSRFIGHATPVDTEEAALAFIADMRARYRDASHHCYAYIIGTNAGIMRYSDDGEPAGTAGLPIIEVLKAQSLVNCAVVVVRYFGGTLLGAGGLIRAYTHGCVIGVKAARVVSMEATDQLLCEVAYPLWDKLTHRLAELPVLLESSDFSATVNCALLMRSKDTESILRELTLLTNGRLETLVADTFFYPWEAEESL